MKQQKEKKMNAVLLAVIVMLLLVVFRVNVVLSLFMGAILGGVVAGLPLNETLSAFETGIKGGAGIALSYAILGAFAMAIAHSGVPALLANYAIAKTTSNHRHLKWVILLGILIMSMMSQNIIPIHIAFILLIIPPLLSVFNTLQLDRRMVACILTFGLVNTYMFVPYGFGDIFLNQIILNNIEKSGMNTDNVSLYQSMAIPAFGMLLGLLFALFVSYKKPRIYPSVQLNTDTTILIANKKQIIVTLIAIILAFAIQLYTKSLLLGSAVGFLVFVFAKVLSLKQADTAFNDGIKMMAMIGFIMITAQGFAEVMRATGDIDGLVSYSMAMFGDNKAIAILVMLIVGLIVTMGIGSSFSTVPILTAIYVPICMAFGMSAQATVALVAVSGVLGDAGSPASDSTLGPTMGLNADGSHDHIKDTVIPTFLHYNIPLIIFGWVAAMVL